MRDCRLRADAFFIRAQSAIRADGPPAAQALSLQFEVFSEIWRRRVADIARSARQPSFLYG